MRNRVFLAAQMNRALTKSLESLSLPDSEAMELADLYESWESEKAYPADKLLKYGENADGETQLWRVLQAHTSQPGWEPDKAPSLFKKVGFTDTGVPIWTHPLGASDAYNKGDAVDHNGKVWVSDLDGNVWEPGVFGWTERT